MKRKNHRYSWQFWTLWHSWDYAVPKEFDGSSGGTDMIFTLNLKFIWQQIKLKL